MNQRRVITILGSAGGVARAVLSILNQAAQDGNDPLHTIIRASLFHLVDRKQIGIRHYRERFPHVGQQLMVHRFNLRNLDRLKDHLRNSGTDLVIDVSWGDTLDNLRCCNDLGIAYVNTALENTMIDDHEDEYEGFPLLERMRIFERHRRDLTQTTAIVCSGMNPGVVQWMAIELMRARPDKPPLGCYVVEHDDSFFADATLAEQNTLYTTWSPECFLDEAIQSHPMLVSQRTPLFLYDPVLALEFPVTLGPQRFSGCLMPHEEILCLSSRYNMEGGFLYRVNEHTMQVIRDHFDNPDEVWKLKMQILDPAVHELDGADLVGVLLVYDDKETFMYNNLTNREIAPRFGVNATYFQVACGVYGAIATLLLDSLPKGIYFIDELVDSTESRYGEYVRQYMTVFVTGENAGSDGLLLQRMRRITPQ